MKDKKVFVNDQEHLVCRSVSILKFHNGSVQKVPTLKIGNRSFVSWRRLCVAFSAAYSMSYVVASEVAEISEFHGSS